MKQFGILGTGYAIPEHCVDNHELSKKVDTSDQWITERTGIKTRYIKSSEHSTSDYALKAAQKAIELAGLSAKQIDLIVVATATPDYPGFPSTAALLQVKLGCRAIPAFDISAACSGFVYGLNVADSMLKTGSGHYALVIGAETLSDVVNWEDRGTCVLFGDAAAAVVLGPVTEGFGCLSHRLYADGSYQDILSIKKGETPRVGFEGESSDTPYIHMNGKAVFKTAIETIIPAIKDHIEASPFKLTDIQYFCCHQANYRILNVMQEKLGIHENQIPMNLAEFGNTSAATIPLLLAKMNENAQLKSGDLICCIGFGAGFTWGTSLIRWGQ